MSVPQEERVVALKFNNQQFEDGTKQTMNTLSKLKEALNFVNAPKGFKELEKAANETSFAGIEESINKLSERFSTLGIVGMRVIENLTDTIMNTLGKAINFVSDTIVSGGIKRAMNIENAHFQLQALLKDEEKVQAVMADAMTSVDGTAYAYDEAAKAASQFAASGLQSGEQMLSALRGIVGVAAMTNSEYEGISRIFTTVAGNGRLMGDQLLQLSSRGLNAASTIADFMNRVNQGTADVTDGVKNAVKEITKGAKVVEGDVREMVTGGEISFQIFSAAMTEAFAESAERANETFTGSFSNMKSALARIGAEFVSPLIEQNSDVIKLFNELRLKINDVKKALTWDEKGSAISGLAKESLMTKAEITDLFDTISKKGTVGRDELEHLNHSGIDAYETLLKYINGVNDGSIRAKYAVKTTIESITGGMAQTNEDIKKLVEDGKIDLSIFTSAMEGAYGDQRGLSKQFTDWFLDTVKGLAKAVNQIDLNGPMEVFYYSVEIAKNGIKGLISLVKPLGAAFSNVFLSFSTDDVVNVLDKIELFTAKLRLSDEASQNLQDAFTGLFNVVKLLIDIFVKLVGVFIPITNPIGDATNGIIGLSGALGRSLTKFTEWVRSSTKVKKAYAMIQDGVDQLSNGVKKLGSKMGDLMDYVYEIPLVQETIQKATRAFNNFGTYATNVFQSVVTWAKKVKDRISDMIPDEVYSAINSFVSKMKDMYHSLKSLEWEDVLDFFSDMKTKMKDFIDTLSDKNILKKFLEGFQKLFDGLSDAIKSNGVTEKLTKLKETLGDFLNWMTDTFGPFFSNLNFGTVISAAGTAGGIWGMIKMFEYLEKVTSTLSGVNGVLGAVKNALIAYETDVHSKTLLKIAAAITLLSVSIALLSTIDGEKLIFAASAIALAGGVLLGGLTAFKKAINAGRASATALGTLATGLASAMKKIGRALEIKAIGSIAKDFGIGILLIIGSIAAVYYLYKKDKDALDGAIKVIGTIGAVVAAFSVVVGLLGAVGGIGGRGVLGLGLGVAALAAALVIVIYSLNKLFKMEFPEDWEFKFGVLKELMIYCGVLGVAAGIAGRAAGEGNLGISSVLGLGIMLYSFTLSMNKLFKMEFPEDWEFKFGVLKELMIYCGILGIVVGLAGKNAGKGSGGFSTIIALCGFLTVAVEALGKLNEYPYKDTQRSVIAIGVLLLAVSQVIKNAAKVSNDRGAGKTITSMALLLVSIAGTLWLLSSMPVDRMVKGVVGLMAVLLILAADFYGIGKIAGKGKDVAAPVIAMVAALLIIAGTLVILSEKPWAEILAASASISLALAAFAGVFIVVAKTGNDINLESIAAFLGLTVALLPISYAMEKLASHNWESLLAAAGGMSMTLLAMGVALKIVGTMTPENAIGGAFALMAALIPLAGAAAILGILASFNFDNLLETSLSLTLTLIGMSVALGICGIIGTVATAAIPAIAALDLFLINFMAVLGTLGLLYSNEDVARILDTGGEAFIRLGEILGEFLGAIVTGIGVGLSSGLPKIGENLAKFADNAKPFFDQMNDLKEGALNGVTRLGVMFLTLSSSNLLDQISKFLGSGGKPPLIKFAEQLSTFGPYVADFSDQIKTVSSSKVTAVANMTEKMADASKKLPKNSDKNKTLTQFGQELIDFGPAIVEFADIVKDVDPKSVEGAASAAEIIGKMQDNLPADPDSLLGWITGTKTLTDFGKELVDFGPAIVKFAEQTAFITEASVQGAVNAGLMLTTLADSVPKEGGVVGLWSGDSDLTDFSKGMESLARALLILSNTSTQVNQTSLSALIDQAFRIVDFSKYVKETGLDGVNEFTAVMEQAGLLGLDAFSGTLANSKSNADESVGKMFGFFKKKTVDESKTLTEQFNEAATGATLELAAGFIVPPAISGVLDAITSLTGLIKKSTDENLPDETFSKIGSDTVTSLTLGQKKMFGVALDTTNTLGDQTITGLNTKLSPNIITPIGENTTNSLAKGIMNRSENAKIAIGEVAMAVGNNLNAKLPPDLFEGFGGRTSESLAKGIESKSNTVLTAATNLASGITKAFQSAVNMDSIMAIGVNVAAGLKKGIESQMSGVEYAATEMAKVSVDSTKKFLDIHSPSGVFETLAGYIPEGFIKGILDKLGLVSDAGVSLADSGLEPVKDAVQKVLALINGTAFDTSPVITPELDLSNIISGTNEINDLFNQGFSANLNSALGISGNFNSDVFDMSSLFGDQLSSLQSQLDELQNTPTQTFDNKFYIQGNDPQEIAEAVSQIISKQVSRKESTWA